MNKILSVIKFGLLEWIQRSVSLIAHCNFFVTSHAAVYLICLGLKGQWKRGATLNLWYL